MKKFKSILLSNFVILLQVITLCTINSACKLTFYQDVEPKSLMRFKKIKNN